MTSKILVTGANGFIGSHFCQRLKLDRISFEKFQGDLTDFDNVFSQISSNDFNAIFHFAGMSNIGDCEKQPGKAFSINALGTFNLIQAVSKTNSKVRFVFASTAQVYDFKKLSDTTIIDENFPTNPSNVYSNTKLIAEQIIRNYFSLNETNGEGIILRLFNHTDGTQQGSFFFPQIIKQILSAKEPENNITTGNLDVYRDFSLIEDLNELLIKIAKIDLKTNFNIYNVCSGNSLYLKDLAINLAKCLGVRVNLVIDPLLIRKDEPKAIYASNKKISEAYNWTPMSLNETEFAKKFLEKK